MLVLKRLTRVVAVVLVLGTVTTGAVLWFSGHRMFAVASASMTPALPVGDLVLTAPPRDVEIGDVVTFPAPQGARYGYVTHRVARVDSSTDGGSLTTRGDANETVDPSPVDAADVVGVVHGQIPRAGYALVFLQQPAGLAAVVTGLFSVALLWDLFFPEQPHAAAARPQRAALPRGPVRPNEAAVAT
ncbi:signal peptidase I [Cellulomonas dongxiuzhuiae]|uniref:Signal peptidase I n=1 Tax=Cellulomonas dongxiuzhuiae TaxID=2819979 RepID=A0ABX8GH27_9CELL|nr:signal peptidase I [Cellulomonas dongxiuzhuiae]MBO3094416.1 signal peptidase I [Cellulomonas dongxiuzhuiae]QWC15444.1 signal peptidase I [Cellulomonas dongxiuzhuiae]